MPNELYRKVGRKYVRASDDDSLYNYLEDGFYLIHAYEGGRSIKKVSPDNISVLAAIDVLREAMVIAMQARTMCTKQSRPLTKKEKLGLAAYHKIAGTTSMLSFEGVSLYDVVDEGIKVLKLAGINQPPF